MKNKKHSFRIYVILTIFVACFALSFFNTALANNNANNIESNQLAAIKSVISNVAKIEGPVVVGDISYYKGLSSSGKVVGFALYTSEAGYVGDVHALVGYNSSLSKITTIAIVEHSETKNVGSKITEKPFINSFDGGASTTKFRLIKDGTTDVKKGEINAITGATVSSSVVVLIVNKLNDYVDKNRARIQN